jgi:hypothetical protein
MTKLYVYGIVSNEAALDLAGIEAIGDGALGFVRRASREGLRIDAIVSDAPVDLRGKRRDLLAHEAVLARLAEQSTLLPMRFGAVAADEVALFAGLEVNEHRYLELLEAVDGRVEFNVKAVPDETSFIAAAAREPAVRSANDAAKREQTQQRRIELGQRVAEAVAQRTQSCGAEVFSRLRPLAVTAASMDSQDRYALNASFLIDRASVGEFTTAVNDVQRSVSPDLELIVTGPLPPYSFVSS